jgi:hypothetical protein
MYAEQHHLKKVPDFDVFAPGNSTRKQRAHLDNFPIPYWESMQSQHQR